MAWYIAIAIRDCYKCLPESLLCKYWDFDIKADYIQNIPWIVTADVARLTYFPVFEKPWLEIVGPMGLIGIGGLITALTYLYTRFYVTKLAICRSGIKLLLKCSLCICLCTYVLKAQGKQLANPTTNDLTLEITTIGFLWGENKLAGMCGCLYLCCCEYSIDCQCCMFRPMSHYYYVFDIKGWEKSFIIIILVFRSSCHIWCNAYLIKSHWLWLRIRGFLELRQSTECRQHYR